MNPVRHWRERFVQQLVAVADRGRAVDVGGRTGCFGKDVERHTLAAQHAADAGESGGQYAFAHTASLTAEPPQRRQRVGASADRNSSSGSTRIVALVSSLIFASHSELPHQPANTKAPSPSMICRKRS